MLNLALSLMMLAIIALTIGAIFLWRRNGFTTQVRLMLVLVFVMVVNIAIWTLPDSEGRAPLDQVDERR